MEIAIQLYGYLILALLGVITPLIAILLPIFHDGVLELTKKYNDDQSRASENLKKVTSQTTDTKAIKQSVRDLEKTQKQSKSKLSYLNPRKPVLELFLLLLISFLAVILSLLLLKYWLSLLISVVISIFLFAYSIRIIWGLLDVLIEAMQVIDVNRKDATAQTINLLTAMLEKTSEEKQPYLTKVHIDIDGTTLKDDNVKIEVENNKEQELLIEFVNEEKRMVKNLELGFTIPFEFVIKNKNNYDIYSGDTVQVVRYQNPFIHGNTSINFGTLNVKPIKKGEYKIKAFIKAENIETIYRYFKIEVTDLATSSQIQKGN